MKDKVRYGNRVIEYTIVKSKRRKTSEIRVDRTGVEVRTPLIKKDYEIKKMVDDKKQWIFKKHLEFSDKRKIRSPKSFNTYSEKAIEKRAWKLASKIGVKPTKIVIKNLRGRWGSSTKNGIINLNAVLTKTPRKVVDYIIVHELCHLKIREHSKRYWNLVSKFMPDYEKQRNVLTIIGTKLVRRYK
ncbi:MAG: M48 family metallopeptidase [Candidatus Paceibacterota bacterium]